MLRHRAHDGNVEATPATPKRLDARLQILDEVPGREIADLRQSCIAPDHAGPAGEDGVGRVTGQHLTSVEDRFAVVERIAGGDLGLLDRLHEGEERIVLELTGALAQERHRAELIVGIPGLDIDNLRMLLAQKRKSGVEIAGLCSAVAAGSPARGRQVVEDGPVLERIPQRRIGGVVADDHDHPLARPVLLEHRLDRAQDHRHRLAAGRNQDSDEWSIL